MAARDAEAFGARAEQLLAAGEGATPTRARYLLGMAMLGHLGTGRPARAREVWERHAERALDGQPPSLALEILRAHAMQPARPR